MKTKKISKAQMNEFEQGWRERNKRLKEIHLPKETFEQYLIWVHGRGEKVKPKFINTKNNIIKTETKISRPLVTGACSTKSSQIYTGTSMTGVAQMHKSNAVPVFSKEETIDISKMRR